MSAKKDKCPNKSYLVINNDGYCQEVYDSNAVTLDGAKQSAEQCLDDYDADGSEGNVAEVYVKVGEMRHVKPKVEWVAE